MTNTIINQKPEKIVRYSGIFQVQDGSSNTWQFKFCKDLETVLDDTNVDRDRVDDGTPVFSRVGDVLGSFRFHLKNTVDLYDSTDATSGTPPVSTSPIQTATYWQRQIALAAFPELVFIETMKAPNSSGNQFARVTFTGRIIKVTEQRTDNVALEDITVEGEIIAWTSAIRQVS